MRESACGRVREGECVRRWGRVDGPPSTSVWQKGGREGERERGRRGLKREEGGRERDKAEDAEELDARPKPAPPRRAAPCGGRLTAWGYRSGHVMRAASHA